MATKTAPAFVKGLFTSRNGGVLLVTQNVTADMRVFRLRENGTLVLLHTQPLTGAQQLWDWLPPIGDLAHYIILPTLLSDASEKLAELKVAIPAGGAYIRRTTEPEESMRLRVIGTGTENETGRQSTFAVQGRRAPVVVWDTRSARTGTLQVAVATKTERQQLEWLLSRGEPVLFNICSTMTFPSMEAVITNVAFTRVGTYRDRFLVDLDYIETSTDEWIGELSHWTTPLDVEQLYQAQVTAGRTYQQVHDYFKHYINWLDGRP